MTYIVIMVKLFKFIVSIRVALLNEKAIKLVFNRHIVWDN